MLINFSNHPSSKWSEKQLQVAQIAYGPIKDIAFPPVDPQGSSTYIQNLANEYLSIILSQTDIKAVHVMGESTLCFALIVMLKQRGIKCLASTTKRVITPEGVPIFTFEQFREY